jgi:PPOX class probable F420-dependent enzyme
MAGVYQIRTVTIVPRLDENSARRRFAEARVARLATADEQGRPHLVSVVFAVRDDVVVIAVDHKPKQTTDLRRLRDIEANRRVCLLADHYDEDWSRLWWVRVDGEARVLRDGGAELVGLLVAKYAQYATRPPDGPVIRIDVTGWRGWAYTAEPG